MRPSWQALVFSCCATACVGTTGSDLVEFNVYAAGPAGALAGDSLTFTTRRSWDVSLTRAKVHIGAMYLNRARPVAGAQETSCTLPGLYVASVPGGLVTTSVDEPSYVDALDGSPQPFAVKGQGTADHALSAAIWLTGGDINALEDSTVMLDVAGTATSATQTIQFEGTVSIGRNREVPPANPAFPGANPMCKRRIVAPISIDITPEPGGCLLLRVDPAGWFQNVDFAGLPPPGDGSSIYRFTDDGSNQPSLNLYATGLMAIDGPYEFSWVNDPFL